MLTDGRTLVGTVDGWDHNTNIVLANAEQRIIRSRDDSAASSSVKLGAYIVRGDTLVLMGLIDEEVDSQIDWTKVHGEKIGTTKNK